VPPGLEQEKAQAAIPAPIAQAAADARGRRYLLAQFAGTYLGLSVMDPVDHMAAQKVAQASLAARLART